MAVGLMAGLAMGGATGLIDVLDTRSFASIWYWLLLTVTWTWVSRGALGIPPDLVRSQRLRKARPEGDGDGDDGDDPVALRLLDWVSLVTPRWQVRPADASVLLALGSFVLTMLVSLGFFYGIESAQAMLLLIAPLMLLGWWRVRLARRLRATLAEAESGRLSVSVAAMQAANQITAHLRATLGLSAAAVAVAAVWGTLWLAAHPNGL